MGKPITRYDELRAEGGIFQERQDCAVIAVALTCQTTYETAWKTLAKFGRVSGKGTIFHLMTAPAVTALGFKLSYMENRQKSGSRYTPRSVGKAFPKGYFLCRVKGHIFAVVDGKVLDHSEGRCRRIKEIYQVTKSEGAV